MPPKDFCRTAQIPKDLLSKTVQNRRRVLHFDHENYSKKGFFCCLTIAFSFHTLKVFDDIVILINPYLRLIFFKIYNIFGNDKIVMQLYNKSLQSI